MDITLFTEDHDHTPVSVTRGDLITAAGACTQAAIKTRKQTKLRQNAGPRNAAYRAWLRNLADEYDRTGARLQKAADEAL